LQKTRDRGNEPCRKSEPAPEKSHTKLKMYNATNFEMNHARGCRQIRVLRRYQKHYTASKAPGFHAHHCFAAKRVKIKGNSLLNDKTNMLSNKPLSNEQVRQRALHRIA
jgi:hypothetical protein